MVKYTALYCRTASPDAEAIARQRTALRRFAEEQGFTDAELYEDDGCSALASHRPAFARLEQDICDGKVARVLSMSVSRLGRNIEMVLQWTRFLSEHGVGLITLKEGIGQ